MGRAVSARDRGAAGVPRPRGTRRRASPRWTASARSRSRSCSPTTAASPVSRRLPRRRRLLRAQRIPDHLAAARRAGPHRPDRPARASGSAAPAAAARADRHGAGRGRGRANCSRPRRWPPLRDDAVAAFFWVANWVFVAQQTDYFTQGGPPSPLQHTWSLAVEEQYYVHLAAAADRRGRRCSRCPGTRRQADAAHGPMRRLRVAVAGAVGIGRRGVPDGRPTTRSTGSTSAPTPARRRCSSAPRPPRCWCADWSALTARRSLIRSRWGRWLAQHLPVLGLAVLGGVRALRDGQRGGIPARHADRRGRGRGRSIVAPVALEQDGLVARAAGAGGRWSWLGAISYGVYLWHWPVFLALNGERTGLTGLALFALRCAGDGRAGRGVVVADRAAHPALAAGARAAAAAGRRRRSRPRRSVTMVVVPVGVKPRRRTPSAPRRARGRRSQPEVPVE